MILFCYRTRGQVRSALFTSLVTLSAFFPAPMRDFGRGTFTAGHSSPGRQQRQRTEWRTDRCLRRPPPQRHAFQVNKKQTFPSFFLSFFLSFLPLIEEEEEATLSDADNQLGPY